MFNHMLQARKLTLSIFAARFRIKKKQWTLNLERTISDLSGRVEELEREAAEEAELGVKADESRVDDVVKHENVHAPGEDAMGLD